MQLFQTFCIIKNEKQKIKQLFSYIWMERTWHNNNKDMDFPAPHKCAWYIFVHVNVLDVSNKRPHIKIFQLTQFKKI